MNLSSLRSPVSGLQKLSCLLLSLCFAAALPAAETTPGHWDAPGGEFSVEFSGKPRFEQVEARPAEGTAHLDIAAFKRPDGHERAEASVNQRTRPITKPEALQTGEQWAKFLSVSDAKMTFDDFNPIDRKLTVKGTKVFDGRPANVIAVFHWGKKTFLLLWVVESPDVFLSPAGARFLASVHQNWR